MKLSNITLFTFLMFLTFNNSFGQDSTSANILIIGKWKVCADYKGSKDYKCKKRNEGFEFFKDGTLKELKPREYRGAKIYFSGKWTLNQGLLKITIDDDRFIEPPHYEYSLIWIDSDRFIGHVRDDEIRTLDYYTHFQRRK